MNARRRLLSLVALAAMLPAWAQTKRKVTIAMLMVGRSAEDDASSAGFMAEMRRRGWIEGQNVSYQRFFTEGSRERAAESARTAVASKPDLIYTPTGGVVAEALKATQTIPIVFIMVSDPVASGYVASLREPGKNVTGVFQMGAEAISKRVELAHEALPRVRRIGVLLDKRAVDYAYQKAQHAGSQTPKNVALVWADRARPRATMYGNSDGHGVGTSYTVSSSGWACPSHAKNEPHPGTSKGLTKEG